MLDDTQAPRRVLPVAEDGDHILGLHSAPVTLMEFGDFECPHCGQAHVVLQELLAEFRDSVRLVFRHFPLTQIHPHAQTAAEATEAAGAQKAFWKMHDTLFENQNALEFEDLLGYADQPSVLQVVVYLITLVTIFTLSRAMSPRAHVLRAGRAAAAR